MKITDPLVIKQGEKDLIDSVQEDLDLDAVREILKERMSVAAMSSRGGQIVVHDNQIAFRLDFEINLSGSLLFDREGNFIDKAVDWESDPEAQSDDMAPLIRERQDHGFAEETQEEDNLEVEDLEDEDLEDEDLEDEDLLEDDLDFGDENSNDEDLLVEPPDYGVEDDAPLDLEDEDHQELALAEEELEDLEEDQDFLDDDSVDIDSDDFGDDDAQEDPFGDDDMAPQDLDDDINDILKESREFWEQKKD